MVRDYVESPPYKALDVLRGTHFHRWRTQSAGITGAARGAFGATVSGGTRTYSFFGGRKIGADVPADLADDGHATIRDALEPLADVLDRLETAVDAILGRETDLRFKPSSETT